MMNQGIQSLSALLPAYCGNRPELSFTKQIFQYSGTTLGALSFSTCSAATFDTVLFLLTCNSQLATADGSDINTKGCTCQWNDDGCGSGSRLYGTLIRNTW